MFAVAERFCSPGARDRERSHNVRKFKTFLDLRTPYKLVDEAGVKAVAGADHIDGIHHRRVARKFLLADPCEGALRSSLDHQGGHSLRQNFRGSRHVFHLRQLAGFSFVGKQNIHVFQQKLNVRGPAVLGVIVRVE